MSGVVFVWSVLLAGFDTCFHRLPNILTLPAVAVTWMWAYLHDPWLILGGIMWWLLYVLLPGFGGGDGKLAASLGALALAHGVAAWCGAVVGASIMTVVIGLITRQRAVAHGPGMLCATAAVCMW